MAKSLRKEMDMCSRPLLGKIIMFSLPLLVTGVLQLLYNAADVIVVGQFAGKEALAAVGSSGSLVNLLTNLFIGLSIGSLAAASRYIGSRNAEMVDKVVHTSILISIVGGIVIAIAGFFLTESILRLMKTPENILPLSAIYLKIFFLGMPFNLLYNFGASILRATGDTKRPLIFLTFAGIVNVVLNLVFVIYFKMSVSGVALATIISQAISAVLIVLCLMKKEGYGKLYLKRLKIDKRALIDILKIGLPAGIQGTIFSFSNVIIQSSVNAMGDIAMAGNAGAASIEGFIYVSMNSISQATLTFTGQNFGAGKKKNIDIAIIQTSVIVTIVGILMGISAFLLGAPLLSIYNNDPLVIASGLERIAVVGITYFTCGLMEVLVGALRGLGKAIGPMIVSIIGVCGIRIVWIFTVFAAVKTPLSLYLSYPVSWVITSAIHFIYLVVVKKKVFRKMPRDPDHNGDNHLNEITITTSGEQPSVDLIETPAPLADDVAMEITSFFKSAENTVA